MSEGKRTVASVALRSDRPTELSVKDLYTWVIWQYPQQKGPGLCGAVRPPIANHGWYPALIKNKERRILVHGNLDQEFSTPEQAAEWLASEKKA
jgi:hypothetical protein